MNEYIMTYFGDEHPSTPEAGKAHFAAYQTWLLSLGDAVVSAMNPLRGTVSIATDGSQVPGSQSGMSGYTILRALTIEGAVAMASNCPFLEIKGRLEIAERVNMSQ